MWPPWGGTRPDGRAACEGVVCDSWIYPWRARAQVRGVFVGGDCMSMWDGGHTPAPKVNGPSHFLVGARAVHDPLELSTEYITCLYRMSRVVCIWRGLAPASVCVTPR